MRSLPGSQSWRFPAAAALTAAIAAAVSIASQGFFFGVNNNFYHIPIVEHWAAEPAFAADPFVQSLRYYVSGFWALVAWLHTPFSAAQVFAAGHFLARWASLAALGGVAISLGLRRLPALGAFLLWCGMTPLLRNFSAVGRGELFPSYFTHTEFALPLLVAACLAASRGKVAWALVAVAALFDINAFAAVWTVFPLALILVERWRAGDAPARLARQTAWGAALAAAIALPVAVWTYRALSAQPAFAPFDYREFLRQYYPWHFFLEASPAPALVGFGALAVAAWLYGRGEGERLRYWRAALLGLGAVFLLGHPVAHLTRSPALLNLHLLRADAPFTVVAVALAAIGAIQTLCDGGAHRAHGAVALLMLSLPHLPGAACACLLLLAARSNWKPWLRLAAALACAALLQVEPPAGPAVALLESVLCAACLLAPQAALARLAPRPALVAAALAALLLFSPAPPAAPRYPNLPQVDQAARWVRLNTPAKSTLLLAGPAIDPHFYVVAHRPIWVSWKTGAAVMWSPPYYAVWQPRMKEMEGLTSAPLLLDYACAHGLDYVAAPANWPSAQPSLFRNSLLQILAPPAGCAAR